MNRNVYVITNGRYQYFNGYKYSAAKYNNVPHWTIDSAIIFANHEEANQCLQELGEGQITPLQTLESAPAKAWADTLQRLQSEAFEALARLSVTHTDADGYKTADDVLRWVRQLATNIANTVGDCPE